MKHELIVALTSRFEAVFDGFAVVNSERFPWLSTGLFGDLMQKHDLFVCPVSFYHKRTPTDSKVKHFPAQYRYGVVDNTRLYDGIVLLDCTLVCTTEALGQLSIHLSHLGRDQMRSTRGMLFSKRDFWLYEQLRGVPYSFIRGRWNEAGSLPAIRSFFEETLGYCRHIDHLCNALNVRVLDPRTDDEESGVLGQGGVGRVIRVWSNDDSARRDALAMKFVQKADGNMRDRRTEHRRLQEHAATCRCSLLVVPTSDFVETPEACGFVMSPVGLATCTRQMVVENHPSMKDVLMALNALHCHKPQPILHGDARLLNLILTSGGLTWIDLRHCELSAASISVGAFAFDTNTLVTSLFPSLKSHVDERLRELIDAYGANPSEASTAALVDYLQLNMGVADLWK
jgi:tRNA A-37 threonylcarbamoyl transferase component Bud32